MNFKIPVHQIRFYNFTFHIKINELQVVRSYVKFLSGCETLGHYVLYGPLEGTSQLSYNNRMNNLPAVTSQESLQVEALRGLQAEIPLNDFGLPTGIYRTDLLPFHDYQPNKANGTGASGESEDIPDGSRGSDLMVAPQVHPSNGKDEEVYRIAGFLPESLSRAYVPLQYDEGFPAFTNGSPFWGRLEYEPVDAFQAFQRYLEMNLGKPADPEDDEDHGRAASGTRSVSQLATQLHPDSDLLKMVDTYQGYYHLYYWGSRSHSYDLFRVAQYRKMQELRAVETQDEHYIQSRRLRSKLDAYFDDEENFWDMLTPKTAIDFHKHLTGLERISAGVPAGGPPTPEQTAGAGKPFEVHLRTIAQTNRGTVEGHTLLEDGDVLDKALEDPETTKLLQDIIIRSGG